MFHGTGILLPAPEVSSHTPKQTQLTILENFHQEFLACLQEMDCSDLTFQRMSEPKDPRS
ncbi:hypothetical protein WA1_28150 [Scytonema hofmannii PCC 7110]|uniref:Uncharacterized protein n=1 Tax=Scytonema hofmannii PCC 7110 TaxID=128403 RepID=A0A139X586_9CYAN|nr:hypothetical protein WA1_28150 [Scytonema hofmannii PCC 7110]